MGFTEIIIILLISAGNVVKATSCWQTTVTVHYTVGPSTISVTQSDANTIMNQVLSHGKNQLSCSGLTLELLNVTIAIPGNLYSISGSFGIIYGNKDGSQKQTAMTCLTNARIFNNIVLNPHYYISPLNGSHLADSAAFTNYQDTTCSINGVQSTTSSKTTLPVVPTSTGVNTATSSPTTSLVVSTTGLQSTTSSKTTLPVVPISTGVQTTTSSPSTLPEGPTTTGVQSTTSSKTLPVVSTSTGVQSTTSSKTTLPVVPAATGVQTTTSSTTTLQVEPSSAGVQSTTSSKTTLPVVPTTSGTFPVKPLPPRNIRIPEKGTKFMRIEWEQPLNWMAYRIQKYIIWYKKRTSSDFNNRIKMDNKTFSKTIEGLEEATRYDFQMYSENSIGQGPSSPVISDITLSARGHSQGQESGVNLIWLWMCLPLLLVIAVFVLVVYRFKKRQNPIPHENIIIYDIPVIPENENPVDPEMMMDKWKEIPRGQLTLCERLGSGAFGMVKKGILQLENGNMICAVKMIKPTAGEEERRDLLNELEILTEVGAHENLVNLIGACTREGPIFIVLEFAEGGSLINYLQSNVMMIADRELVCSLPDKEKIQIGLDIAKGMQHLAHVKCVHRDLAARNVLLTGNKRAKVADFGMSRDVYETGIYERATPPTKVPVRWLAPEAVKDYMFTTKGDIWSYGVVLWEIESGGKEPYGDPPKHVTVVDYVVNYLYQGQRLPKPGRCRQEIYNVMLQCWQMDPNKRPSFHVICIDMEALLHQATNLGNCTTHSSMA